MKPQTKTEINSNVREYLNREFNAFIEPENIEPEDKGNVVLYRICLFTLAVLYMLLALFIIKNW